MPLASIFPPPAAAAAAATTDNNNSAECCMHFLAHTGALQVRLLLILLLSFTLSSNKRWKPKQIAVIQQKPVSFVWNFRHNNGESTQADVKNALLDMTRVALSATTLASDAD